MIVEELYRWCSKRDVNGSNWVFDEPFTDGEYLYATTGHLLVRTTGNLEGVGEVPEILKEGVVTNWLGLGNTDLEYKKLPESIERMTPRHQCEQCGGFGRILKCEECGNSGYVVYVGSTGDFDIDCPACEGNPRIAKGYNWSSPYMHFEDETEECGECCGTGYASPAISEDTCVSITCDSSGESRKYNPYLIQTFLHLPGIVCCVAENGILLLRWDDGEAAIMHMNF